MSVPCIEFVCNRCDFIALDEVLSGPHSYRFDGREISIDRELGWCMQCQTLVAIERFHVNGKLEALKQLREDISAHNASWLRRLFRPQRLTDLCERLSYLRVMLEFYERRRGTEKCLRCSSIEVVPIAQKEYDLELRRFRYHGIHTTSFRHPGCGGTIIAQPHPVRYHRIFSHRIYDHDGVFLGEED
ncbi:hypothetical protein [Ferrimonas balearica]|uniref:hypothetical protein n=1 Tax=Ferrimonas balearica TaxID=44012 RepID=UPI001C9A1F06|nr:hypothetical protein [Ferrimonas balearica]MBY5921039.1 hypothetical protein [Ferrimonas balearica]MBY5996276.1 hypothetical protein [Ferrimonas balearica]